ncbi:hypothetical protein K438DRAFT_1777871 [Mycena galopus ATCC 62051]|nr:hypothetical protein K438DRAFT_1777871 [Mycena galopus ATCC 62051]
MSEQFGRSSVGTLRIPRSTVIYTRSAYVHITARTWPLNAVFVARGGWVPTRSVSSSEDSESGLEGIREVARTPLEPPDGIFAVRRRVAPLPKYDVNGCEWLV